MFSVLCVLFNNATNCEGYIVLVGWSIGLHVERLVTNLVTVESDCAACQRESLNVVLTHVFHF